MEQVGPNLLLSYQSTQRVLTVAARDIWQYGFANMEKDGTIKLVCWNAERPEEKGRVRMQIPLAGVNFKPLQDDARGKTQVIFYVECHLGGSLPQWFQRQAIKFTYLGQNAFRKLIPQYLKTCPQAQTKPPIEQ